MATYGIGTPGVVPFTGWTNTLAPGTANAGGTSGNVSFNGNTQMDDKLAKAFRNGGGSYVLKAVWLALTGAATGGTVTATSKRVLGTTGDMMGGPRPIETVTWVNRVSGANDLTALQALLNRNVFPASYPPDLSGNGGGGKGAW